MQPQTTSTEMIATKTLGPFSERDILSYLKAAHDDNPVHRDDDVAVAAGFMGRPVPGMMLMAQLERLIETLRQRQRVTSFTCRFLNPIYIGTAMVVSVRSVGHHDDGSVAELVVTVSVDGKVSIQGQVRLASANSKYERR